MWIKAISLCEECPLATFSSSDCAVHSSCTVTDVLTVDPNVGRRQLLPCSIFKSAECAWHEDGGSRTQSDRVMQGWFGISVICALSNTISSIEPVVREYSVHAGVRSTWYKYAKMIHKMDD